jgi:hypothetical protein
MFMTVKFAVRHWFGAKLVPVKLYVLGGKLLVLILIINYLIILFYVPSVSKILEFSWTVSSIFITALTTYLLKR